MGSADALRRKRSLYAKNPYCAYCPKFLTLEEATLDHIKPVAKGGAHALHNLTLACLRCNQAKGTLSARSFKKRNLHQEASIHHATTPKDFDVLFNRIDVVYRRMCGPALRAAT